MSTSQDKEVVTSKNASVVVTQREGFSCTVSLRGEVLLPPEQVFDILVHPDNHRIFSSLKSSKQRIVADDRRGRQVAEVEQLGQWRFLAFRGQFTTRLHVESDRQQGTIDFRLTRPGFMKDFKGQWKLQPQRAAPAPGSPPRWWSARPPWLQPRRGGGAAVVTLEQSVLPALRPPPPLDGLVKRIAAHQIRKIMGDLEAEVDRIKKGKARLDSLPWLNEYAEERGTP